MNKLLLTFLGVFLFVCNAQAQIIINEIESDAGNFESSGEWIELKNIGAAPQDMSCWRFANGGSYQLTFPTGLVLLPGQYLIIGNAAKMMCSSCDYKFLNTQFSLNASGFGPGTGAYSNTVFLNTDIAANGGCDCMDGSGAINNGNLTGDRLVLYDDAGNIIDAMMFSNGDNYAAGAAITVNFNALNACPPLPNITVPVNTDVVYNGRTICNDLKGCNSSYARIPDGNNGASVTWAQSGNLACTGCTNPCGAAVNTASADYPTPGLDNSSNAFTATLNGSPVNNAITTINICGATPQTFQYQINNFTNAALTATQPSGNFGSYVRIGNANPINFTSASFNNLTGVTTLTTTITPPVGTSNYEFVWGDANTNCNSCPGSNSVTVPNNNASTEKECYVYRKITFVREEPQGGTPVATCSLPGSITISGATGTNLKYTLQKQTVIAGPFNTIAGPQNGNSFGGIIDDDADPNLPNYQVLVTTTNVVCANPPAVVVAVPVSCLGNPACAKYVTSGPGMPVFTPANNSTVCAGSTLNFTVNITGVCNTGLVELMYDYNPAFNPYTQGTSLGTANTTVGATPPTNIATGKVFINEFVPRPATGACAGTPNGQNPNSGEWIELYNAGPGNVDIGGWSISDGDWTATIPAGTIMASNSYFLIGGGGTLCSSGTIPDLNVETCNCATVSPISQDIMNLTDGGEQIALFDCSGNFVDGVLWGGGQGLPDAVSNTALATGCGNYITQKNVSLPAAASFANSGGSLSGTNEGRFRNSGNTWTTFTNGTGTPKAANPTVYNGAAIASGTECPPPPVTANVTVNLPDTCNQLGNVALTVKAIYKPEPVSPCVPNDVIATANYTIPSCELLTLSGDGTYCNPASAPLSVTTSSALAGNYIINFTNGINTANINPATGAGPFTTNVNNSGTWTISSVVPPVGSCAPKTTGSANISILTPPVINSVPANVNACYIYAFDLASIEPQIVTTPFTTTYYWYDMPTGGSPISTIIFPTANTTYYVSATTGAPANCEGARVPVNIVVDPLPNIPTVVCNGITAVFTQPVPDCMPAACPTGVQYSANGINWSNSNTYTAADPGWTGWGSPANSTLYVRNTSSPNCYNYTTFINPCNSPLPVTLLHFTGRLGANKSVDLKWTTSQEKNVSQFEVEKKNANGTFSLIGNIKAAGNSDIEQSYTFNDAQPYQGDNFYRLKIMDEDGQYTYSNVVQIYLEGGNSAVAALYPNPASTMLYVDISSAVNENSEVLLTDITGKLVQSRKINISKGYNTIPLDIKNLAKGNYMLKIKLQNKVIVSKFSKE